MSCCNKIRIPKESKKTIQKIIQHVNNTAVKSNRSPAGTIIKECSICKCRSVTNICPVCGNRLIG